MQVLKCDWGIMYLCVIDGEGVVFVFINLFGIDLWMWDDVVVFLFVGWLNLCMDKCGYGLSSIVLQGYGILELVEDVLVVMDYIGFVQVVIVGCFIGGLIVQYIVFMVLDRVIGLVFLNIVLMLGNVDSWLSWIEGVCINGMVVMVDGILQWWFGFDMFVIFEIDLWWVLFIWIDMEGYIVICVVIAGIDIIDCFCEIIQFVLVIGGYYDQVMLLDVVEKFVVVLFCFDLVMFDCFGYFFVVEQLKVFVYILMNFVERIIL